MSDREVSEQIAREYVARWRALNPNADAIIENIMRGRWLRTDGIEVPVPPR